MTNSIGATKTILAQKGTLAQKTIFPVELLPKFPAWEALLAGAILAGVVAIAKLTFQRSPSAGGHL